MKHFIPILSVMTFAIIGACSQDSNLSDLELCKITYNKYPILRDDPAMGMEYGALFTETGAFAIGDTVSNGRDAIIERHRSAHKSAVWVHELAEPTFTEKEGKVFAKGNVVVLTGPDKDNLNTRIEGIYDDEFEILGDVCRIKTRKTSVTNTKVRNEKISKWWSSLGWTQPS